MRSERLPITHETKNSPTRRRLREIATSGTVLLAVASGITEANASTNAPERNEQSTSVEHVIFSSDSEAQARKCNPEKIKCTKKRFYNKLDTYYSGEEMKKIWPPAKKLVDKESSWDYNIVAANGACYLPQALPCEKLKKTLKNRSPRDIEGQAKWMNKYVKKYDEDGKRGGWEEAWRFFQRNGWY